MVFERKFVNVTKSTYWNKTFGSPSLYCEQSATAIKVGHGLEAVGVLPSHLKKVILISES